MAQIKLIASVVINIDESQLEKNYGINPENPYALEIASEIEFAFFKDDPNSILDTHENVQFKMEKM